MATLVRGWPVTFEAVQLEREHFEALEKALGDVVDEYDLSLLEGVALGARRQPVDQATSIDDDAGVLPEEGEAGVGAVVLAEDDELDVVADVDRLVVDVHLRKVVLPLEDELLLVVVHVMTDGAVLDVQADLAGVETIQDGVELQLGVATGPKGVPGVHAGKVGFHDGGTAHAVCPNCWFKGLAEIARPICVKMSSIVNSTRNYYYSTKLYNCPLVAGGATYGAGDFKHRQRLGVVAILKVRLSEECLFCPHSGLYERKKCRLLR